MTVRKSSPTSIRVVVLAVLAVGAAVSLQTCDFFKPGFGDKVDVTAPVVAITSPAQNSYVRGAFTVSGTVSDDIGVSSMSVSYPGQSGTVTKAVTFSGGAWSIAIPTGTAGSENLPDGEQHVTVSASDASGKQTSVQLIAFIDNIAPTVLITVPQGYGTNRPTVNASIDIKGEVWDRSPITGVTVEVIRDATGVSQTLKTANGTYTWSASIDTSAYADTEFFHFLVKATDKAGNVNAYYYHSQDIWTELLAIGGTRFPATDEIGLVDQTGTGTASGITYASLQSIQIGDPGAPTPVYGNFYRDADASKPVITYTNIDTALPTLSNVISTKVPITGIIQPGPANVPITQSSIRAWIVPLGTVMPYPGYPAAGNVDAGALTSNAISTSFSFSLEPKVGGSYIASGQYTVLIRAEASGTPEELDCDFIVDAGAPRIDDIQPPTASLITRKTFAAGPLAGQTGVEIMVTASDDNDVQTVSATASLDSDMDPPLAGLAVAEDLPTNPGDYYVQVPLGAGNTAIWFEVEVEDNTGSITRRTVQYTIDEINPSISITSPTAGSWVTGNSTTVSGTSSDNSGNVKDIYVWVGLTSVTPPAPVKSTWTRLDGNASWATTLALGAEGSYTAHAYAFDFADNQSAEATRSFYLDQSNPTVTETSIGAGAVYRSALFTLSGTAADTNALANITMLQVYNGGAPSTVLNQALSGTSQPWTWTLPGGSPDGTYEYTVTLTDAAGKTAPTLGRTVVYDTTAPSASFTDVTPLVGVNTVNGVIAYSVSASDANGLTGVRRWVLPAVDPDPSWSTGGYTQWASTPYSATLDTTTLTNGQQYEIWIIAQDKAGKETAVSQLISVDQSSDLPVVGLTNMDPANDTPAEAAGNLQETNAKVQGTLTDDDGVDASTIEISIDGGAYAAVGSAGPDGKSVSFEQSFTSLSEGVHYFSITAYDLASLKSGKPAVQSALGPVYFAIDKNPPALAISSPAQGTLRNGGGSAAADFTMIGTASDANGIPGNTVTIREGATVIATPAVAAGSWSYGVDVDALTEGAKTWTVEAVDAFSKSTTVQFTFTVDKSAPAVGITTPSAGVWYNGATLSALGTATDANGVVAVQWSTNGGGSWSAASGTSNWSVLLDLVALGEGNKTLSIRATDAASNTSGMTNVSFGVDQTAPDTTETAIGTPTASSKVLFELAGTATDSNALTLLTVDQNKDGGGWVQVHTTALSGTSQAWSVPADTLPRNPASPSTPLLADGSYAYRIIVTDVAGNTKTVSRTVTVDLTPPTATINDPIADAIMVGTAYSVSGTAADTGGSGVATVYWWAGAYGATPPAFPGSWNTATGTTNWNALLNLTTLGEGRRTLHVRAVDGAANEMAAAQTVNFYIDQADPVLVISNPADGSVHSADFILNGTASDANLSAVNISINGSGWSPAGGPSYPSTWETPITIGSLNSGSNTISVRASDFAGRTTTQSREVFRDQAAPGIAFNNLEAAGTTVLMESSPKAYGNVTDATGVFSAESYVESWNGSTGTMIQDWATLGATGNAKVFSWQKDLSATGLNLSDGWYRITIRSSDVATPTANATSGVPGTAGESVVFRIDRNNPGLTLTAPAQGSFQRTTFSVTGTSSDANAISSVRVKVDSSDFGSGYTDASTSDGFANWSVSVTPAGQGPHTIYVQATDGASRTTMLTRDFTFDSVVPTLNVITPLSGAKVNGAVTVKGTSSDTNAVSKVELRIGKNTVWNLLPGVYSWEYAFTNIDSFAILSYADETPPSSGVWRLYLHLRVTDTAGNESTNDSYYLDLDPGMDSPITTIYQPLNNQTVGGSTRVYGIATDDDAVFRTEMQIDVDGDGNFTDTSDYWNYSGSGTPTMGPDGDTNDLFENEATWYTVSGTTNWYQIINQFGEYNAVGPATQRTIQIRVRAVDTKDGFTAGVAGNYEQITVTFDNTIPTIENVKIDLDATDNNGNETTYSAGIRVSGTFWITADVNDNMDVAEIWREEQGPLTGTDRIDDDPLIATPAGNNYKIRLEIDTLNDFSGAFTDTSGTYSMALKAVDGTPYTTYCYLNIQVDNYYPTGTYTNVQPVMGYDYKVQGTATDVGAGSGPVQGIQKVVGYFVKGTDTIYDPSTAGPSNYTTLSTTMRLKDTDGIIKSNVPFPTDVNYQISIDSFTERGVSDLPAQGGDNDGYLENLTINGNTYDWWAQVDTRNLPDGLITFYYVAFDSAGNGRRFAQELFVSNHAPILNSITLGTDLDADGNDDDPGEKTTLTSGYGGTNFKVRNNYLTIAINATSGNGNKHYSVMYGGVEKNVNPLTATEVEITNFGSMPDTDVNDAVFSITVFDSTTSDDADRTNELTQSGAPLSLAMTLDNDDEEPPTLDIATFGWKYTLPSPNKDEDKVLDNVDDYNENIVMAGSVRQGHVEYAADSRINGNDADVSGKIRIMGKVKDDQRINRITATISNFNGGAGSGNPFNVATWNSGTNVLEPLSNASPYWAFTTQGSAPEVSEAYGHVLNWGFAWDSSQMTGGAGNNQTVTFDVYDFGGNHYTVTPPSIAVDVVPYITSITRNSVNTNRTRYGRYPVKAGETGIVLAGFNLVSSDAQDADNWIRIYNGMGSAYSATTIAVGSAGSARTGATIEVPAAAGSGFLRVSVNGFQDANRQNNNSLAYNKEDDGSGIGSTLWTDDRYLHVWTVNQSFSTSSGAQYPSMSIMGDGTLYGAWIDYASSNMYYGTTSARTLQWGIYDPPEYTDINVDASEAGFKYAIAFAANHYGGSGWGTSPLDVGSAGFLGTRTPNSRQLSNGYANSIAYAVNSLNLYGASSQLWQFNRPKVVRSNGGASDNQDRIHTAYYDSKNSSVKYSFMYDDGFAGARGWLVLDGTADTPDVRYVTGIATGRSNTTLTDAALIGNAMVAVGQTIMLMDTTGNRAYPTITAFNSGTGVVTFANQFETARTHYTIVTATSNLVPQGTGVAQSLNAGEYIAIDVDEADTDGDGTVEAGEGGMPAVVYYNTAAQTLRLARANKVNPTAPADWTRQDVFPVGDPNAQYSGQHVAMKFDADGGLHVVCYRSSTGDLLYLYAPDADNGAAYAFQNSVVIDSVGAVGTWADISMQGAVPHVSYLNSSMIGTFDGIKYATLKPITQNTITSSSTTSATATTLIGNAEVAAGQIAVFSDNTTRVIDTYTAGTGEITWTTGLGAAPTGLMKIVSSSDWEYEIAPAYAAVTDQRTNIEVKRGSATWGDVALGFRTTRFELMYAKSEP